MKKILAFTLALILFLPSWISLGATNEGYGEDETALGQYVDSFEDMNSISVNVSVERNATLNAMELNFTVGGTVFEDFTTYTEVDEDGDVTVTAPRIDWVSMRRDAETYVWKDFGVDYFGDLLIKYEVNVTDLEAGDATSASIATTICFSNVLGVVDDLLGGDILFISFQQSTSIDDRYGFYIRQYDGGVSKFIEGSQLNFHNVPEGELYATFSRVGTNVTLWMYSDSARITLIYKYSTNAAGLDEYRYMMLSNWGRDVDPADHFTGYLENLNFGGLVDAYDAEGYFTTVDYLGDPLANGSALVAMVNTSIPANTQILMQFSDDNATWGDNEGIPLDSHVLNGGFESIDLREINDSTGFYYRFNLSTTDSGVTPRVYQNRLITTIGNSTGGAGPPAPSTNWGLLWFFLILICVPIALILLKGSKR